MTGMVPCDRDGTPERITRFLGVRGIERVFSVTTPFGVFEETGELVRRATL